jgi:hypothetical protein
MTGIVRELQKEALDRSVRVSDLLRKALLVARKLKAPNIEAWIVAELNGYSDGANVPAYRTISGEIKSWNPYNGAWLPIIFPESDAKIHRALTQRKCNQAIAEIESLLSKAESGQLAMPYPPEVQAKLMKAVDLVTPPVLLVSEARLHGIVDAIRTATLDWALQLEENGVLGQDLSFSDADRRAASHIVFNIGSMSHSQIQAETSHSQQLLAERPIDPKQLIEFVGKAREALVALGLPATTADELRGELDTLEAQARSPKPKQGIIRESLKSVRTILEGATGNAIGEGLIATFRILFG